MYRYDYSSYFSLSVHVHCHEPTLRSYCLSVDAGCHLTAFGSSEVKHICDLMKLKMCGGCRGTTTGRAGTLDGILNMQRPCS